MYAKFVEGQEYVYRAVESFTIERSSTQARIRAKVSGKTGVQEFLIDQKTLDKAMNDGTLGSVLLNI